MRNNARRLIWLFAVALLTVPTVLSFTIPIGVIWLAVNRGSVWLVCLGTALLLAGAGVLTLHICSDHYFRVLRFEESAAVYERLGIRYFRHFVVGGDYFNYFARRYDPSYTGVTGRSLPEAEAMGRLSEKAHVSGFLFMLPPALLAVFTGWYKVAALLVISNVVCNIYPVMLQRYTRRRIRAIMQRRRGK